PNYPNYPDNHDAKPETFGVFVGANSLIQLTLPNLYFIGLPGIRYGEESGIRYIETLVGATRRIQLTPPNL
ncbi:hypothetical protein, partial [Coleofasciculus chthonoplastes]|uniref:hypothetical protein n=1 Tax=Coleofasciculus chthonoplastes TaxID=64178 RepID=UPI0032F85931